MTAFHDDVSVVRPSACGTHERFNIISSRTLAPSNDSKKMWFNQNDNKWRWNNLIHCYWYILLFGFMECCVWPKGGFSSSGQHIRGMESNWGMCGVRSKKRIRVKRKWVGDKYPRVNLLFMLAGRFGRNMALYVSVLRCAPILFRSKFYRYRCFTVYYSGLVWQPACLPANCTITAGACDAMWYDNVIIIYGSFKKFIHVFFCFHTLWALGSHVCWL